MSPALEKTQKKRERHGRGAPQIPKPGREKDPDSLKITDSNSAELAKGEIRFRVEKSRNFKLAKHGEKGAENPRWMVEKVVKKNGPGQCPGNKLDLTT